MSELGEFFGVKIAQDLHHVFELYPGIHFIGAIRAPGPIRHRAALTPGAYTQETLSPRKIIVQERDWFSGFFSEDAAIPFNAAIKHGGDLELHIAPYPGGIAPKGKPNRAALALQSFQQVVVKLPGGGIAYLGEQRLAQQVGWFKITAPVLPGEICEGLIYFRDYLADIGFVHKQVVPAGWD